MTCLSQQYFYHSAFLFVILILLFYQDHGADVSIEDIEGNTPINYAIVEGHQNIIDVFKKHIFKKKLEGRFPQIPKLKPTPSKELMQAIKNNHLSVPTGESQSKGNQIYTPNRQNYNFDVTSPYYVNITHRRKKLSLPKKSAEESDSVSRTISYDPLIALPKNSDTANKTECVSTESDTVSGDNQTVIFKENLFQLTEDNLRKHLDSFSSVNRVSLVNTWRKKVHSSRNRKSILPNDESELDSFISKYCKEIKQGQTSTPTSVGEQPDNINTQNHNDDVSESFTTAIDILEHGTDGVITSDNVIPAESLCVDEVKKLIKSPNKRDEIILQVENYMHTDNESDVVFYETKLLRNPKPTAGKPPAESDNGELDDSRITSDSVPSTEVTIPLEYDTDDLRRELTMYGEPPGPITKSTKRLYLKKLIKYKRQSGTVIISVQNDRLKNHRSKFVHKKNLLV